MYNIHITLGLRYGNWWTKTFTLPFVPEKNMIIENVPRKSPIQLYGDDFDIIINSELAWNMADNAFYCRASLVSSLVSHGEKIVDELLKRGWKEEQIDLATA